VLAFEQEIAGKLSDIETRTKLLAALRKELAAASANYLNEARSLSKRRYEIARKLEKTVEGEINDLAMKASSKSRSLARTRKPIGRPRASIAWST